MLALAILALAVALAASAWTTAYAWTTTLPELLWLDRTRRREAWLDTIDAMHVTLARLEDLP